jgi:polar amino acid transport system substrate-binding protein
VLFLGPIATQNRDILFLVKAGEEARIKAYEDLYKVTVGVKRRTVYFDRFNADLALHKIESIDDENMARMFIMGRFDTMAVLDRAAIENALKHLGYDRFSYADYRQSNRIEHYFGMSRNSPHFAIFDELNQALLDMVASGRIKQIYHAYGLAAELE